MGCVCVCVYTHIQWNITQFKKKKKGQNSVIATWTDLEVT